MFVTHSFRTNNNYLVLNDIFYDSELSFKKLQFDFIRIYCNFTIISPFSDSTYFISRLLKRFFYSKGIDYCEKNFHFSSLLNGVNLLGYKFFFSHKGSFSFQLSMKVIRSYKIKLRSVIKSYFNLSILKLINLLNTEINDWNAHFYSSCSHSLKLELDIYLSKIVWRFVKKLHSRRPNTWIYSKYWISFSGTYKFFYFDKSINSFIFLASHRYNDFRRFCLPMFLDAQNFFNYKLFFCSVLKKSRHRLLGFYRQLFVRQRGLCKICFKPLLLSDLKLLYYSLNKSLIKFKQIDAVIIHSYCSG